MNTDLSAQTLEAIHAKRAKDYQLQEFEITAAELILDGCMERLRNVFVVVGGAFTTGAALKRCADSIEGAKAALGAARVQVQNFERTGVMQ